LKRGPGRKDLGNQKNGLVERILIKKRGASPASVRRKDPRILKRPGEEGEGPNNTVMEKEADFSPNDEVWVNPQVEKEVP